MQVILASASGWHGGTCVTAYATFTECCLMLCWLQAGHLALPFWSAYNVSKAGLDILSDCLRYELADQGIPVILVKPGPVLTPIWEKSRKKSLDVVDSMPQELQQLYGATLEKVSGVLLGFREGRPILELAS